MQWQSWHASSAITLFLSPVAAIRRCFASPRTRIQIILSFEFDQVVVDMTYRDPVNSYIIERGTSEWPLREATMDPSATWSRERLPGRHGAGWYDT